MSVNSSTEMMNQAPNIKPGASAWRSLYKVGGAAALGTVLVGLAEILITFLPGGNSPSETVLDWFTLFQTNWFIGLRNLGLLNIIMTLLGIPVTLAFYGAHRRVNRPFAALAVIISFIGVATFFATNRAFPMLDLSRQYAAATTDAQRAALVAAGQAMLSVGQSHTSGTYLAFFLAEVAGLTMSAVMLRSRVFGKATAYVGLVGYASFLVFEFLASFVTGLSGVAMVFAMIGGLLTLAWNVLIARRLFQLAQTALEKAQ
jgi:hypothetical protein